MQPPPDPGRARAVKDEEWTPDEEQMVKTATGSRARSSLAATTESKWTNRARGNRYVGRGRNNCSPPPLGVFMCLLGVILLPPQSLEVQAKLSSFNASCPAFYGPAHTTGSALRLNGTPLHRFQPEHYVYVVAEVTTPTRWTIEKSRSTFKPVFMWEPSAATELFDPGCFDVWGPDAIVGGANVGRWFFGVAQGVQRGCRGHVLDVTYTHPAVLAPNTRYMVEFYFNNVTKRLQMWEDGVEITISGGVRMDLTYARRYATVGCESEDNPLDFGALLDDCRNNPWNGVVHSVSLASCPVASLELLVASQPPGPAKNNSWIVQTGAIAGVVVGGGALCLAGMTWLLLFRRKRLRQDIDGGGEAADGDSLAEIGILKTNGSGTIRGLDSVSGDYRDDAIVKTVIGIVREAGLALLKEDDVVAERSIGQGSHGMVYSARWKNSNTPVAVKVLQLFGVTLEEIQKGARAITNELVVLNTVRHPSVIHVYGVVVTSDAHTPGCAAVRIVMELAECSLQQLLTQTALMSTTSTTTTSTATSLMSSSSSYVPLSERSLESYSVASEIKLTLRIRLRIAESVASGLSHLHTARVPVVHRDLKPANILIRRQGDDVSACIADFGVALLDKTDMTLANPESYLPQGTLMYMVGIVDPSLRGRRSATDRIDLKAADVYSMGCLLSELLAREPFAVHQIETEDRQQQGDRSISEDWEQTGGSADSSMPNIPSRFTEFGTGTGLLDQTSPESIMFKLLERRLWKEPPSVAAMMEGVLEGVPRRCIEIVRACLLLAPERPSPENVATVFREAYNHMT